METNFEELPNWRTGHCTYPPARSRHGLPVVSDRAGGSRNRWADRTSRSDDRRCTKFHCTSPDGETESGFSFVCDERDLDYWLNGNAPVILVRSRPRTHEAYWVSLKEYFNDTERRKSRKILFNKSTNSFDVSARDAIWTLAIPKDAGIFRPPIPRKELLYSSLLPVTRYAETLYVADTQYRLPSQLWFEFNKRNAKAGGEWFLKEGRIFSLQPLDEFPFCEICDNGSIERFKTQEWADSDSTDRLRDFVRLLNRCLSAKLFKFGVKFDRQRNHYYFRASEDLKPRTIPYTSLNNRRSHREIFRGYESTVTPNHISYYRHSAFEGQFLSLDASWFLQITPTYRYTWNGYHVDGNADERLAGIKRLERNGAVLGQLVMWGALLSKPPDLFRQYSNLEFGGLQVFRFGYGIDDATWLPKEENEEAVSINTSGELFS